MENILNWLKRAWREVSPWTPEAIEMRKLNRIVNEWVKAEKKAGRLS